MTFSFPKILNLRLLLTNKKVDLYLYTPQITFSNDPVDFGDGKPSNGWYVIFNFATKLSLTNSEKLIGLTVEMLGFGFGISATPYTTQDQVIKSELID